MSTGETLYRLQSLDSDIDVIRRRVFEIDRDTKGTPALLHTRTEFASAEAAKNSASEALARIEEEARALEAKIGAGERKLYDGLVKVPKELVEAQTELQELKHRRQTLDDGVMLRMESLESASADEARCRQALSQAERKHADDCLHWKAERARIIAKLTGQAEQRASLVAALPPDEVTRYQQIRAKKPNGLAVVLVQNGSCGGCGDEVSSGNIQHARSGHTLICSNCGRMLYSL